MSYFSDDFKRIRIRSTHCCGVLWARSFASRIRRIRLETMSWGATRGIDHLPNRVDRGSLIFTQADVNQCDDSASTQPGSLLPPRQLSPRTISGQGDGFCAPISAFVTANATVWRAESSATYLPPSTPVATSSASRCRASSDEAVAISAEDI